MCQLQSMLLRSCNIDLLSAPVSPSCSSAPWETLAQLKALAPVKALAPQRCCSDGGTSRNASLKHNNRQLGSMPPWLTASPSFQLTESLDVHFPQFSHGKLLSELCTWGIGGPARLFCEVHDELQLASTIRHCSQRSIRFLVIGKGSNCLFDDRGFDGCIILNRVCFLQTLAPGVYHAGSGYPFNVLGMQCSKDGFSGLEFASGIPGTVGGAVFMNAGADGQETAGVLKSVEVVTTSGNKHALPREKLSYSYRSSPFQTVQEFAAIASATFELTPSPTCRERQRNYLERRRQTQPLADRTAGCVFRNPGSGRQSAGSLIDKAGLKGVTIGGAKVSDMHANFVVNVGGSRATDIIELISFVKEQVRLKLDVDLEEEIMYVPYR